uniref:Retrovirus-related Pol polyprotein from transposon TNT 1-94 n=1 Tax=Cannabis sativa TaxID=3483 RepID=A0A803QBY2_CANSA
MDESKEIRRHLDDYNKIILNLNNLGVKIEEEDQAIILLSSLPKMYEYFVDTIFNGEDTLTMTEVKAALCSKEIQKKDDRADNSGDGLFIAKGKFKKKDYKGYKNSYNNNKDKNDRFKSKAAAGKQCYYYKEEGPGSCIQDAFHMTPNKELLSSFLEEHRGTVLLGNNRACEVKGIGSVEMQMHDGVSIIVQHVRYVRDLKRNLLSIGMFDKNGYAVKIEDGILRVFRVSHNSEMSTKLWHLRLGHVSQRGMDELNRQGVFKGGLKSKLEFCEECVLGKSCKDKLQPRALKCMFLGYPDGLKGYKLWCMETGFKKCIISRDVVFKEDEMAMKTKTPNEIQPAIPVQGLQLEVDQSNTQNPEEYSEINAETDTNEGVIDLSTYQLARDRVRRETRPPSKFGYADFIAYALLTVEELESSEPTTYLEATTGRNKVKWLKAIDEEMTSLKKNKTWIVVKKPEGKKLVGCKWIFKEKEGIRGVEPVKFKAKLVAKGFTQQEGVDFNEIFSPVVKKTSIRVMMAKAAREELHIERTDELVTGYVDSDYARCLDTKKSFTGFIFTVYGGCVSWKSNLKKVVALSSTKAEYMAETEAIKEAIWLKGLTSELGINSEDVTVHCDNKSALHLMKNPMFHERTKNIDIKMHFIRDVIQSKIVSVRKIDTHDNPVDAFTKSLTRDKFRLYLELLNINSN